jgi:hypothetical protein
MKTGVALMRDQGSKLRGGPIMSLRGREPEAIPSLVGGASCPLFSDRQDAPPTRNPDWTPDRSPG